MSEPLRIGVAGLGVVGTGTLTVLERHHELIADRCGRPAMVTAVSARDRRKERGVDLSAVRWFDDPTAMASDPEIDVVVELIGGEAGVAKDVVETALAHGKHVVTANKAMLAHAGTELAGRAEESGAVLACEAAVCGGIPAIKTVREGLAGNAVEAIYGILNGSSNYILTTMRETGREFGEVLADTQKLGYAEADPSLDVDGIDAAHKLAILTALAFNTRVDYEGIHVEGIREVSALDINYAEELGYRIKLLGIARRADGGIEQRVHPCMVPKSAPIANVEGVNNAVVAEGDFVGNILTEGAGAGAGPTASAVVADIMDIARGTNLPTFAVPASNLHPLASRGMHEHQGGYYLRLMCLDRPGVLTEITAALRDEAISVESMVQRGRGPSGEPVPIVITTHETREAGMMRALKAIEQLDAVLEAPRLIRIENP
ncbi:homoserine dehydrogenase [Limimonas halophila]|uniref:Homoserine dehydrogenase n=1 Tax=Limimonas halophila TaxID=1082479 RepID=A0A1G7NRZ1_9PROT|nr:homoserine dehydrogenase [Limimonas halophila]SDF76010.1 homoserine dehydrogenase [Limimonas halophila]